jgi:hypothetical protein
MAPVTGSPSKLITIPLNPASGIGVGVQSGGGVGGGVGVGVPVGVGDGGGGSVGASITPPVMVISILSILGGPSLVVDINRIVTGPALKFTVSVVCSAHESHAPEAGKVRFVSTVPFILKSIDLAPLAQA